MMRARVAGGGSTTMVVEAESTVDAVVDSTMTVEQLLVSLDVAVRGKRGLIVNTVLAILEKAEGDAAKKFEYVCQIILIAFKRRNHEKSQAHGTGSGEKDILRTILLALNVVAPEAVKSVLPLVPIYGSWKDLNLMAERYLESLPEGSTEVPGLCSAIVNIFADQLDRDNAAVLAAACADKDPENLVLPSSAAKYAFSEARHRGSKKNRKVAKASRAHKIQAKLADLVAQRLLGKDAVLEKRESRPLYRKFVAALRAQLASNGFMIEHHMCNKTAKLIHFTRAPKGALEKYKNAINKDPDAMKKWQQAAKKSQAAVPDIEDLRSAAMQAEQEADCSTEDKMLGRRFIKAVASMKSARASLVASTQAILDQLDATSVTSASRSALQGAMDAAAGGIVYPVVDTFGVTTQDAVDAMLMAAYIVARSQPGCACIGFNGRLIRLQPQPAAASGTSTSSRAAVAGKTPKPAVVTNDEIECAMQWYTRLDPRVTGWRADDARDGQSVGLLLQQVGAQIMEPLEAVEAALPRDLMLIATTLPEDTTALVDTVNALQAPHASSSSSSADTTSAASRGFRSVLVHKLQRPPAEGIVDFKLRTHGRTLPPVNQMTIDVCILMDFTGSMGGWMRAAKEHLTTIIRSLQHETRAKEVRIAFVGYRDYKDDGRVVIKRFVDSSRADEVIEYIQQQQASGGGDIPEDVLIGVNAVNDLEWKGDIRMCLHVADATAHGYTKLSGGHDNYPSGQCPDQQGQSLSAALGVMADERCVDLIFCDCASYNTKDLKVLYRKIYPNGGYGVLPLESAASFKEQVLGALSAAVLSLHVADDVQGLQSFVGDTLSALISTMNSSMRESLLVVGAQAEALQVRDKEETVSAVAAEMEMDVEGEVEVNGDDGPATESVVEAAEATMDTVEGVAVVAEAKPRAAPKTRTDYERLASELQSQDLAPVRLMLGMPVASSLALSAGRALIDAGLTVTQLQEMGYPAAIVQVFVDAAAVTIKSI